MTEHFPAPVPFQALEWAGRLAWLALGALTVAAIAARPADDDTPPRDRW